MPISDRLHLLADWFARRDRVTGWPPYLEIELTNRCLLTCKRCWKRHRDPDEPVGCLDPMLYRSILDQAQGHVEYLFLFGLGESLLHPDVLSFVALAHARGFKTHLATSGMPLEPALCEALLDSGLDALTISFDGATPSTYEACRVGARFDDVRGRILDLLERKRRRRRAPWIDVQMLLLPETRAEVRDFYRLWDVPGVDAVRIKGDHVGTAEERAARRQAGGRRPRPCHVPWEKMSIAWTGEVISCSIPPAAPAIGDCRRQGLAEIWNSDPFRALRRAQVTGDVSGQPDCQGCAGPKPSLPLLAGAFLLSPQIVRRTIPIVERLGNVYRLGPFRH